MKKILALVLCLVPSVALAADLPVHGFYCSDWGKETQEVLDLHGYYEGPNFKTMRICRPHLVSGRDVIFDCFQPGAKSLLGLSYRITERPDRKSLRLEYTGVRGPDGFIGITFKTCEKPESWPQ